MRNEKPHISNDDDDDKHWMQFQQRNDNNKWKRKIQIENVNNDQL